MFPKITKSEEVLISICVGYYFRERGIWASALGWNMDAQGIFCFCPYTNPLRVHILSEGRCSYSPLPSPLFQSQVGHSLIRRVASLLSPKMNCIHHDNMRQCIGRGGWVLKMQSHTTLTLLLSNTHSKEIKTYNKL